MAKSRAVPQDLSITSAICSFFFNNALKRSLNKKMQENLRLKMLSRNSKVVMFSRADIVTVQGVNTPRARAESNNIRLHKILDSLIVKNPLFNAGLAVAEKSFRLNILNLCLVFILGL